MKVGADFTLAECEKLLALVNRSHEDFSLKIPTRPKLGSPTAEASFIQMLLTWAFNRKQPLLVSYAKNSEDPQLRTLANTTFGLAAILCAERIRSGDGRTELTEPLRAIAYEQLKLLAGTDTEAVAKRRGISLEVLCADHLSMGNPRLLYNVDSEGAPHLRDERNFQSFAKFLIHRAIPPAYQHILSSDEIKSIGTMVFEIFKNTHQHALHDLQGDRVSRSIRGLLARHYLVPREKQNEWAKSSPQLATFFSNSEAATLKGGRLQVLEISIFDSGIGFAQRLAGRTLATMSNKEEHQFVLDCFKKNISTKTKMGYGQGLPMVLRLLHRHRGLFRIRTGRLSLHADLSSPQRPIAEIPRFFDDNGNVEPASLSPVRGTLINILLPLNTA